MKISRLFCLALMLIFSLNSYSQIVITEIMYNPPEGGTDSLEYIEIYNSSAETLNLNGYSFEAGVIHTFGDINLSAGNFLVVAVNSQAMMNVFGVQSIQWESGGLRNTGERIAIQDAGNNILDEVSYEPGGDWPVEANGSGNSLELCDPSVDNSLFENWLPSNVATGIVINGGEVKGSPGSMNGVMCPDNPDIIDVVITEFLYNDPGSENIEFIELYNNGNVDVNLQNWNFSSGITYVFPSIELAVNEYLIVCRSGQFFEALFGIQAQEWTNGDELNDTGGTIQLKNDAGEIMDEVTYSNSGDWPSEANGLGSSLVLCHPSLDNSDVSNWQAAITPAGFSQNGVDILANPNDASFCKFSISELKEVDADGASTKLDWSVITEATVYGVNLRSPGLQLTIIDNQNNGIALINITNDFGYTVTEGDGLRVKGTLDQFNGLMQIELDTAWMTSVDNTLVDPNTIATLNESTESQLIKIENVSLKTTSDWTNSGSGFNVTLTNGSEEFDMRIDADVNIFGMEYPSGSFSVTGIGGQFDNTLPYTDGYQILPRYVEDLDPYIPFEPSFPFYEIGTITTVNSEGVYDSMEVSCEIRGIVYGINFRPEGLHFTLIDDNNDGIRVFHFDDNFGYNVTEGDRLSVKGETDQFSGVIELVPSGIDILSTGNSLRTPDLTTVLDESTESQLVMLENLSYVNQDDWKGDGSDFDVAVTDGTNTYSLRIDKDSELSSMTAPFAPFNVIGLGSQFDTNSPYTEDYDLYPRYFADFETILGVYDAEIDFTINVFPNPVSKILFLESEKIMEQIRLIDIYGVQYQRAISIDIKEFQLNLANIPNGMYYLEIIGEDWRYAESIIVIK